jgi:carbonic anhydrase/acetyltransferase-like protein (isoleucine patch superfamily)
MGDRDFFGENAVVFRAKVGDDVQIGEGAVVAGPPGRDRSSRSPTAPTCRRTPW